jgi:hypothetical protein
MKNNATVLIIAALPDSLVTFRYQLLQAMVERGYTVIACAAKADSLSGLAHADVAGQLARIGVSYYPIPLERTGVNPLKDIRTFTAIYALCRRFAPDVLFCYTAKPVIYGSLAGSLAGVLAIHAMITGLGFGVTTESLHVGLRRRWYACFIAWRWRRIARSFFIILMIGMPCWPPACSLREPPRSSSMVLEWMWRIIRQHLCPPTRYLSY